MHVKGMTQNFSLHFIFLLFTIMMMKMTSTMRVSVAPVISKHRLGGTCRESHMSAVMPSFRTEKYRSKSPYIVDRIKCESLVICQAELRNIDWPEALLFDCDGVLVDTEAEGHRVAFNEAFKRKGLNHSWNLEQYGVLLEIGGGKERMDAYFSQHSAEEPWASVTDLTERKAFLKELHELKTDIFNDLIESGKLPVRPGVIRLINEAIDADVKVAVCSTSNERAVSNIVKVLLGDKIASKMRVFAGDVVPKKKPSPDIYNLAANELEVSPARCVVIEDSKIGLAAGKAAGMRVVVTESYYTKGEDFDAADAVFDCIGDEGSENFGLSDLTTPGSFWLNPPSPAINS